MMRRDASDAHRRKPLRFCSGGWRIVLTWTALWLLAAAAPCVEYSDEATSPTLQVVYVPRGDFHKWCAESGEGSYLPLSEIRELVRRARADAPDAGEPVETGEAVVTGEVRLDVQVAPMGCEIGGTLDYTAEGRGWAAARLDDGTMPWVVQENAAPNPAMIARVDDATWLFARAPGRGTVRLRALQTGDEETLVFRPGFFHLPCRAEVKWESGLRLQGRQISPTLRHSEVTTSTQGGAVTIWPAATAQYTLIFRRDPNVDFPEILLVDVLRWLSPDPGGTGITVLDRIKLNDWGPDRSEPVEIRTPRGAEVVQATCLGGERLDLLPSDAGDGRRLRVHRNPANVGGVHIEVALRVAADDAGVARLHPWGIAAAARDTRLRMQDGAAKGGWPDGERRAVVIRDPAPNALPETHTNTAERALRCFGEPPVLEVAVVPAHTPIARSVEGRLDLTGPSPHLTWEISYKDDCPVEARFRLDPAWRLAPGAGHQEGGPVFTETEPGVWRVWPGDRPLNKITAEFSPSGAWTSTETRSRQELPLLNLEGPRPVAQILHIVAPPELQVRCVDLQDIEPATQADAAATRTDAPGESRLPPGNPATEMLAVRVTGPAPRGRLEMLGREPVLEATVVTTLNVQEDLLRYRARCVCDVRLAPADTFRISLPRGAGQAVRVEGPEIRERVLTPTADADVLTLTTQRPQKGQCLFTLSWESAEDSLALAVSLDGPVVRVLDAATEKGFLILQGSPTLKLDIEARNLVEVDPSEVPFDESDERRRTLAAYRYVRPPFTVRLTAARFDSEPLPPALIREGRIETTLSPEGHRLTRATWRVVPRSDYQFFEALLPKSARVWSVSVDGEGVRPSRRTDAEGRELLLAPLEGRAGAARDREVSVVYMEPGDAMPGATRLDLRGPSALAPVHRTEWTLHLPPGFEYLAFGGNLVGRAPAGEPLAHQLRSAYYPARLFLLHASKRKLFLLSVVAFCIAWLAIKAAGRLARRRRSGRLLPGGFAGRLFLVMGAVVVLVVLAVVIAPRFAGIQTMASVSRVRADLHSLSTAIEAYSVDYSRAPTRLGQLSEGPDYVPEALSDPFLPSYGKSWSEGAVAGYRFLAGAKALEAAREAGMVRPDQPVEPGDVQVVYSLGPDGIDDGGRVPYDPTNGTRSRGDIVSFRGAGSDAGMRGAGAAGGVFAGGRSASPPPKAVQRLGLSFDAAKGVTNGAVPQAGDELAVEQGSLELLEQLPPPPSRAKLQAHDDDQGSWLMYHDTPMDVKPEADSLSSQEEFSDYSMLDDKVAAGSAADAAGLREAEMMGGVVDVIDAPLARQPRASARKDGEKAPAAAAGPASPTSEPPVVAAKTQAEAGAARSRQAGLMSLDIEIPEGGVTQTFSALGGKEQIVVRYLKTGAFERTRFLVGLGLFLALSVTWWCARPAYRRTLLLVLAVTLLFPVLIPSAWTVFVNAAFLGAFASLLLPLLAWATRHGLDVDLSPDDADRRGVHVTAVISLTILLALVASTAAASEDGASPAFDGEDSTVHVFVPYDLEMLEGREGFLPWEGDRAGEGPVFIRRGDFERLWRAAHRRALETPGDRAPLLGDLLLEGRLAPDQGQVDLKGSLRALNPSDRAATVTVGLDSLSVEAWRAEPSGAILQSRPDNGLELALPANWQGVVRFDGRVTCAVDADGGHFLLDIPPIAGGLWRTVLPEGFAAKDGLSRRAEAGVGTLAEGALKPGPWRFEWARKTPTLTGESSAPDVRCDQTTWVEWWSPGFGSWRTTLVLTNRAGGACLPRNLAVEVGGGLDITDAAGKGLELARLETPPGEKSRVVLQLGEVNATTLTLHGILLPSETGLGTERSSRWSIPAANLTQGVVVGQTVQLLVSGDLKVHSIRSEGLERCKPNRVTLARAPSGGTTLAFNASDDDWQLALDLSMDRAEYHGRVHEVFVPEAGFLRRSTRLRLESPQPSQAEITLSTPPGLRVFDVRGAGNHSIRGWVATEGRLYLTLGPPRPVENGASGFSNEIIIDSEEDISARMQTEPLKLEPIRLVGVQDLVSDLALLVPPDLSASDIDSGDARDGEVDDTDRALLEALGVAGGGRGQLVVAWQLPADGRAPSVRLQPARTSMAVTVVNRLVLEEGSLQLEAIVTARTLAGRPRELCLRLLNAGGEASTLEGRIEITGPIRGFHAEPVSETEALLRINLNAGLADDSAIRVRYSTGFAPDAEGRIPATIVLPVESAARPEAFLVLRRALEAEVEVVDPCGATPRTPTGPGWPAVAPEVLPSDQVLALAVASPGAPVLGITRHEREQALEAVVEVMRLLTVLSEDGVERCELEMDLRNRSAQFLPIALPAERDRVRVEEVRVADRPAPPAFDRIDGREALVVPLVRTGYLEPRVAVRIVYTVDTGRPLSGYGSRTHSHPEILGDIPISESTMVLMLPAGYRYDDFEGSLHRVEMADLQVDEALRTSKRVEELSRRALSAGEVGQQKALRIAGELKKKAEKQVEVAQQAMAAQNRAFEWNQADFDADAVRYENQLQNERLSNLDLAIGNNQFAFGNFAQVAQMQQQAGPAPSAPAEPEEPPDESFGEPFAFPRAGETFAFRQIQGVGLVRYDYAPRSVRVRAGDLLTAVGALLAVAFLLFVGPVLFATPRRAVVSIMVAAILCAVFGLAVDLAAPLAALAVLVILVLRKRPSEA